MKQLSVFLENREGRLEEALCILKNNNINIVSLSLADTTDYGMLRLIVNDPENGQKALKGEGFSAHLSNVVAIRFSHTPGSLHAALDALKTGGINIEYMYALCTKTDEAAIVIKPSNIEDAVKILEDNGFKLFTDGDVF